MCREEMLCMSIIGGEAVGGRDEATNIFLLGLKTIDIIRNVY